MAEWGVAHWYHVLTSKAEQKSLVFAGDWTLYPRSEQVVEMIRHSGEMVTAEIEDDGICRVRTDDDVLPLPDEVVDALKLVLDLV